MEDWICEACNGPLMIIGLLGSTEHGRCRGCGLMQNRQVTVELRWADPERQLLADEEGLTADELEDGMAQFDAHFPNDMKGRG